MKKPYKHLAKYYDLLMPDIWYHKWYNFAEKVLQRKKIRPRLIVDAGCGTGRLTKLLASLGPVMGFDQSAEMLRIARKKYPQLKVFKKTFLDFYLPGKKRADLIVCAFDSLNYTNTAAELRQIFINFYNNLQAGGCLLFDMNGENAFAGNIKTIKNIKTFKLDDATITWNNFFYARRWKVVFEIKEPAGKGAAIIHTEQHVEFYYSPKKIISMLSRTGFMDIQIYKDTAFHAPGKKNERYFFVAQK